MRYFIITSLILFFNLHASHLKASDVIPAPEADPHYTKIGFFDIHVCNWPERKLFFMSLFSSYDYKNIDKIEIYTPGNSKLGEIGMDKYRIVTQKGKPEKRVFISQLEIPETANDGWYRSVITTNNGEKYEAKDYVIMARMGIPVGMKPEANMELKEIPAKLSWQAVPGAKNYRVFIRDSWEQRTIHSSKILTKPELKLPKGLLKKGGIYNWMIHARDVNENALLGDFNHGSLNTSIEFSIE
jgi:hypothetical protein